MFRLPILSGLTMLWLAAGCSSTPSAPSANERRAEVYLQAGADALENRNYTDALRNLGEGLKYNPKNAMIWANLGIAYAGKNEPARAEESWKRALQLDPSYNDARLNLGIFYIRQQRYPEAERILREATKDLAYGRLAEVEYNLGVLYLAVNKPLLAEGQFRASVKEDKAYCPSWLRLGLIQKDRGDYAEAANSMKNSVMGTCYKNPRAHYEIAQLYLKAHEIQLAKSKLLEIIQLFPTSEWASRSESTLNMIR